jgi:hypothetical protein
MRRIKIFSKLSSIALLFIMVLGSCEEAADLSIDPIDSVPSFTFSPEIGYPGSVIVITGTNLSDVAKVAIGTAEATIISKSASEIKVEVPVKAQSGKIVLTFASKVYTSDYSFTVSDTPVPAISEFSPLEISRGGNVTIEGALLNNVKRVYVGSIEAEIVSKSDEKIVIIAPDDFTTASITLIYDYTTTYGMVKETSTVSAVELALLLPSISSVEPALAGLNIGDILTIEGTSFNLVDTIMFGTIIVDKDNFTFENGVIKVAVPTGATSGSLALQAKDGVFVFDTQFVVNLPSISSFTPQKGSPSQSDRPISVLGTNLNLVDSVYIGNEKAMMVSQSANQLLFTIGGETNGTIQLFSANGIVKSAAPFAFAGNFWVNDWDNVFDIVRFRNIANNGIATFTEELGTENGNNFAQLTMSNIENGKSFYLWGPDDKGDDRFSLYVSDPNGVYLEFDMKVIAIDAAAKQEDGTLEFKIYSMDAKGWGASGEYSYGANGPTSYVKTDGQWQSFRMHLKDFVASGNSGLYTAGQVEGIPGAFVHPNSIRILTWVFGIPGEDGAKGNIVLGLDNVKFVIE